MKILPRTYWGNPILRTKTKSVPLSFLKTALFRKLEKQMVYTMRRTGGIGLAANQIGRNMQIAVLEMGPTRTRPNLKQRGPLTIINPKIIRYSKSKTADWEGCLSFKGVRGKVPRPRSITVSYIDGKGKKVTEEISGLWARIFQHETDHLNGFCYVDRMEDMKTLITVSEFKKRILKKK